MRARHAVAGLALLCGALVGPSLPVLAAASAPAPYEPVDPPFERSDRVGNAVVFRKGLAKTDLTRREARAADLVGFRFDTVQHDGEPSAQVAVTFRRLLPSSKRVEQEAKVYFDDESYLQLFPRADGAAYLSSYGGRATRQPGCSRLDSRTIGSTITTWVPVRCLYDDSSEMTVDTSVRGTRTGRKPGSRGSRVMVGSDGSYPTTAYIRWR